MLSDVIVRPTTHSGSLQGVVGRPESTGDGKDSFPGKIRERDGTRAAPPACMGGMGSAKKNASLPASADRFNHVEATLKRIQ